MIGYILFVLAVLLSILLTPIGIVFHLVYLAIRLKLKGFVKQSGWYFKMLAVSIDQFGNVALGPLLNKTCLKEVQYSFGDEDDTISKVLHYNRETLSRFGRWLYETIEKIDPGHYDHIDLW